MRMTLLSFHMWMLLAKRNTAKLNRLKKAHVSLSDPSHPSTNESQQLLQTVLVSRAMKIQTQVSTNCMVRLRWAIPVHTTCQATKERLKYILLSAVSIIRMMFSYHQNRLSASLRAISRLQDPLWGSNRNQKPEKQLQPRSDAMKSRALC